MTKEFDMDMTDDFRQCVMKLANTYNPDIELSGRYEDQHVLFEEFARKVTLDFSNQLYPIFLEALYEKFDQQQK